jgi:hypothetical protein
MYSNSNIAQLWLAVLLWLISFVFLGREMPFSGFSRFEILGYGGPPNTHCSTELSSTVRFFFSFCPTFSWSPVIMVGIVRSSECLAFSLSLGAHLLPCCLSFTSKFACTLSHVLSTTAMFGILIDQPWSDHLSPYFLRIALHCLDRYSIVWPRPTFAQAAAWTHEPNDCMGRKPHFLLGLLIARKEVISKISLGGQWRLVVNHSTSLNAHQKGRPVGQWLVESHGGHAAPIIPRRQCHHARMHTRNPSLTHLYLVSSTLCHSFSASAVSPACHSAAARAARISAKSG